MYSYNGEFNEILIVDGKEYEITYHARQRMLDRKIEKEQLSEILINWVAKKFKAEHNSTGYFGIIPGHNGLIMVAVSANAPKITTIHFDRNATKYYYRGDYSYFDETRNETESPI